MVTLVLDIIKYSVMYDIIKIVLLSYTAKSYVNRVVKTLYNMYKCNQMNNLCKIFIRKYKSNSIQSTLSPTKPNTFWENPFEISHLIFFTGSDMIYMVREVYINFLIT